MSVNATAAIDGTSSAKTNASDGGHSDSAAVARRWDDSSRLERDDGI